MKGVAVARDLKGGDVESDLRDTKGVATVARDFFKEAATRDFVKGVDSVARALHGGIARDVKGFCITRDFVIG